MAEDGARRLRAAAQRVLAEWALHVTGLELVSRSENVVFKLTTRGGARYAMRVHRPGYNSLAELESEQAWTEALRAAGVDTPAHVPTRDGRGYATVAVDGARDRRHVGVIEWFEAPLLAERIEKGEPKVALYAFERLGRVIAGAHAQATAWEPPAGFSRRAWDAEGLVGDEPLWGRFWEVPGLGPDDRALLCSARETLHQSLVELGRTSETFGLIHADLHPYNILVDGDRLVIIDFDDCGFGWHAYDLAVALYDYRLRPDFPALRDALVRGYRQARELDDELVALLPAFLLIRSLLLVGWLRARPEVDEGRRLQPMVRQACREAATFVEGTG